MEQADRLGIQGRGDTDVRVVNPKSTEQQVGNSGNLANSFYFEEPKSDVMAPGSIHSPPKMWNCMMPNRYSASLRAIFKLQFISALGTSFYGATNCLLSRSK